MHGVPFFADNGPPLDASRHGSGNPMSQVKKPAMRDAILRAAAEQFRQNGYAGTSLARVAQGAGTATSNLYVYFDSKLDLLFALAGPWLLARMDALAAEAAGLGDARARLAHLLNGMWRDIPADPDGYAVLLIEAFSALDAGDRYSLALLRDAEARLALALATILPEAWAGPVSHLAFMAFDGFTIGHRLGGAGPRQSVVVEMLCDLLVGQA